MSPAARALRVLSTAVTALVVALAVSLVGVRLVGLDVYTVLSGSMEPTYHTGSVIWVKPCEAQDVEVGDPITFVMNEDLMVATHRVVAVDEEAGEFTTKGDANEQVDGSPVLFENLIGRPVFSVPGLGYFVAYVQNPPGCYIALAAGAVILMLMFLPTILAKDEPDESRKKAKARKAERRSDGRPGGHARAAVAEGKRLRRERRKPEINPEPEPAWWTHPSSEVVPPPENWEWPQETASQPVRPVDGHARHAQTVRPVSVGTQRVRPVDPRLRRETNGNHRRNF